MNRPIIIWPGWASFHAAKRRAEAAGAPPPRVEDLRGPTLLSRIQQAD